MKDCCSSSDTCQTKSENAASTSVVLAGNPNCGKTTLFNALTGSRQRVGNWPGVTVERKSGFFNSHGKNIEVIDLPGIYSLTNNASAIDEKIACEYILAGTADIVINIVDASNLERHLYLTIQLLEMGIPVILAINMMDVARARGIAINLKKLAQTLGCPVVALEANKNAGIVELKRAISEYQGKREFTGMVYPSIIVDAANELAEHDNIRGNNTRLAQGLALLESDLSALSQELQTLTAKQQANIRAELQEDADILIADARYQFIQQITQSIVTRVKAVTKTWTSRIDNLVLNRVLGVPIFLAVMYLLFLFSINIGGAFQDFFDISSNTIFVDGFATLLTNAGAPSWLTVLLANGIGKGINTTVTFIPVIGAMFLFLAFLEDSGYMARAAFVVDRMMRMLGLPGKAFVPMIVGFGCNVPAVMAARTLENKRDRIITIMMSPFMSCGARLAIYTVFATAFFPRGGQNIVFALYLIGIFMAVLTGFILRKTLLKGDSSPLVMELPAYHLPRTRTLMLHAWQRLRSFVFRAGKLIVPICILIGALNSLNLDGSMNAGEGDAQSLLSLVGQWLTPIFTPMGIHADNWPATVGLVTGVLAKEVVIGTLNTLYSQMGHLVAAGGSDFHFWAGLQEAVRSIPQNFAELGQAFSNPVLAKAPIHTMDQGVYGVMFNRFDGQAAAFSYLLFVLLYFPCVSTMAAMVRELHKGWAVFSALWTTGVAYAVAVVFYQAATFPRHPLSSAGWILLMSTLFFGTIALIYWISGRDQKRPGRIEGVLAGEAL